MADYNVLKAIGKPTAEVEGVIAKLATDLNVSFVLDILKEQAPKDATKEQLQAFLNAQEDKIIEKMAAENQVDAEVEMLGAASVSYTHLYVQVDAESGELLIYDEEDVLVEKTIIFDWVNTACDDDQFTQQVAATLKAVLAVLVTKKVFDNPCFLKPFSVSLTDEDFSVIEELLFLDDENLRLDDPLLKDLDADLDDFLAKLLSDVK